MKLINIFSVVTLFVILGVESLKIPSDGGSNTALPIPNHKPIVQEPYFIESEDSILELIEPKTSPFDRYGHSIVANTNVFVVGTKLDTLKADLYVYIIESPDINDDKVDDYYKSNDDTTWSSNDAETNFYSKNDDQMLNNEEDTQPETNINNDAETNFYSKNDDQMLNNEEDTQPETNINNDDQNQYDTQPDRRKLDHHLGLPHFTIKSAKITSPENYGDGFGLSTSLTYDGVLLVGASKDRTNGANSGASYFYHISDTKKYVKITQPDAVSRAEFGSAVSIHNELAIIGANGINAAYVYSTTLTASLDFKLVTKLSPQEDYKIFDVIGYGSSISSDYKTIAITAPKTLLNNYTVSNGTVYINGIYTRTKGAVYIYDISNDSGSNVITNTQVITPDVTSLISWMKKKSKSHYTFTFGEFIYFNDEIGLITVTSSFGYNKVLLYEKTINHLNVSQWTTNVNFESKIQHDLFGTSFSVNKDINGVTVVTISAPGDGIPGVVYFYGLRKSNLGVRWVELEKKSVSSENANAYGSALAVLSGSLIGFNKILIGSELGEGYKLNTGTVYIASHPISIPGVEWYIEDNDDKVTDDYEDSTLNNSNNTTSSDTNNTIHIILFVTILSSVLTFLILYYVDPSFSCLKAMGVNMPFGRKTGMSQLSTDDDEESGVGGSFLKVKKKDCEMNDTTNPIIELAPMSQDATKQHHRRKSSTSSNSSAQGFATPIAIIGDRTGIFASRSSKTLDNSPEIEPLKNNEV